MATQFDEITIDLDKARTIKFDINSLAELEDKLDKPCSQIFGNLENVGMRELRLFLWAGLIHEDETLTPKQAAALISHAMGANLTEKVATVMAKVLEAVTSAFGTGGTDPNVGAGAVQAATEKAPGTGDGQDK